MNTSRFELLSDHEQHTLRGKCLMRFALDDDVWTLLNHYTVLEQKLDELDDEDALGTEGWRHVMGIPE